MSVDAFWLLVFLALMTWPWWVDRLWPNSHTPSNRRRLDAVTSGPSWTPPQRLHAGVWLPADYEGFGTSEEDC